MGRYANSASDRGGETYCGISRVHHPSWGGWSLVDRARSEGVDLSGDGLFGHLLPSVRSFYKDYVQSLLADRIHAPKPVVRSITDHGVNGGKKAATHVQQDLCNQLGYSCDVDGLDGPNTRQSIRDLNDELDQKQPSTRDTKDTLAELVALSRIRYYIGIANRDPSQRANLRGWINRVFECYDARSA